MKKPTPQQRRQVGVLLACAVIGWLLGGLTGLLVGACAAVAAQTAPAIVGLVGFGALVGTAAATVWGGSGRHNPIDFVDARPLALDAGQLAGVLLCAWLITQFLPNTTGAPTRPVGTTATAGAPTRQRTSVPSVRALMRNQRALVTGSSLVSIGFLAQAGTGALFWALAAHRVDQDIVGLATGTFTALQFVNYVTALGLTEMLSRFRPETDRDRLLGWSVIVTVATSVIGTVIAVALITGPAFDEIRDNPAAFAIVAACAAGNALAAVADARLVLARRWSWVMWRLIISGAARIPLLYLVPNDRPVLVFVAMTAPIAISGVVGLAAVHYRVGPRLGLGTPAEARPAVAYATTNWFAHLAILAPQFVLPVIVQAHVAPALYASFYVAWTIAAVAFILPVTVGRVLLAESTKASHNLAEATRAALGLSVAAMAVATVGAAAVATVIPMIYGEGYRDAARILPWIVAGGIPWSITSVVVANARARGHHLTIIVVTAALAAFILGIALAMVPSSGLDGAITAWGGGNILASLVAVTLVRFSSPKSPDQPGSTDVPDRPDAVSA